MFLINGHKQESLAVSDRATQFGDGCFTTARVIDGKVSLLSAHIQRLQDACQRLMISCDFWPQLEQEMKTLAAEQQNGVLKVVISRGSGGRGYSTLNSGPATRILSVTAYPAHYDRLRNEGMTLALSPGVLNRAALSDRFYAPAVMPRFYHFPVAHAPERHWLPESESALSHLIKRLQFLAGPRRFPDFG